MKFTNRIKKVKPCLPQSSSRYCWPSSCSIITAPENIIPLSSVIFSLYLSFSLSSKSPFTYKSSLPIPKSKNPFFFFFSKNGSVQQQPGRIPQHSDPTHLHSDHLRWRLALQAIQHRMRAFPWPSSHRSRRLRPTRLSRWPCRLLLQSFMASLGLPTRHVSIDSSALLLHHFRFCCYEQGRWRSNFW